MNARDELIELMESSVEGRCRSCHKPIATDEQWETVPEGEGVELCWNDPGCMEEPDESTFAVPADALIADGWRKMPSRRELIDAYQVVWAEWQTREAPANTGYPTFREHLADAILALMDRGSA